MAKQAEVKPVAVNAIGKMFTDLATARATRSAASQEFAKQKAVLLATFEKFPKQVRAHVLKLDAKVQVWVNKILNPTTRPVTDAVSSLVKKYGDASVDAMVALLKSKGYTVTKAK